MVNAIRSILPYLVLFVASAPESLSLRDESIPRGELSKWNILLCSKTVHILKILQKIHTFSYGFK